MEQFEQHICTSTCAYCIDLDKAATGLAEASRLLSASILSGSDRLVETRYASVRAAWLKLTGAVAVYRDHFAEV
jgi:hypothetical protein